MITDTQLQDFCDAVQTKQTGNFAPKIIFERGRKNARIICDSGHEHRHVFCFVDLDNGNILKAAGWKAPARHARGNIANGAKDVGQFGPAYLK